MFLLFYQTFTLILSKYALKGLYGIKDTFPKVHNFNPTSFFQ